MSESSSLPEPLPAGPRPDPGPEADEPVLGARAERPPSFVFFGILAALSLLADVATKAWAEIALTEPGRERPSVVLIEDHLSFTLAYNPGGAWGLLQSASEHVRRPFFLFVSIAAVIFIFSLYSRLSPGQRALKWGLPLVLGGALGNLADRVIRSSVVDFIDYRADWILSMNRAIAGIYPGWNITDHWPTFNVADVSICTGVVLMAIDMIGSRKPPSAAGPPAEREERPPAEKTEHADSGARTTAPVEEPGSVAKSAG